MPSTQLAPPRRRGGLQPANAVFDTPMGIVRPSAVALVEVGNEDMAPEGPDELQQLIISEMKNIDPNITREVAREAKTLYANIISMFKAGSKAKEYEADIASLKAYRIPNGMKKFGVGFQSTAYAEPFETVAVLSK